MTVVLGVVLATFVAFVGSSIYYAGVVPFERRRLGESAVDRGRPRPWQIGSELVRTALVASVVAWVTHAAGLSTFPGVLGLALMLWIGFPAVLLAGSVTWEKVPVLTATMHAGDWLLKLLVVAVAIGLLH